MGVAASRVSVVYNGVNREMFAPGDKGEVRAKLGLRPSATHLIGVGNLVSVKGFDLLLDACATLTNSPLDWELHLLGDGKLEAQLRQQAKQLGIADKVHFRGRVPQNVLADWMRAADLLVLSSRSEGIPNVLMEALSSELPYVATDVGSVRELADFEGGIVVPPHTTLPKSHPEFWLHSSVTKRRPAWNFQRGGSRPNRYD
jgi:glycosyltransferase involved in cell wall biosynthesis